MQLSSYKKIELNVPVILSPLKRFKNYERKTIS